MPAVGPDVGTVAVPKTTVLSVTAVWVKKLTCPPRVAGTTVAVRVVLVPDSTGLAGLAAKVTPETRIEPISAAGEPAVQLNTAPPTSKETDAIPTDTFVPGLPVIGTVVDSPVEIGGQSVVRRRRQRCRCCNRSTGRQVHPNVSEF